MSKSRLFLFLLPLYIAAVTVAQVFIPMALWTGLNAELTISDAVIYDYGSINAGTPTDKTFTIINTGVAAAASMTAVAFSNAAFSFKGGVYPGTGGTCGSGLGYNEMCTIVVSASSATTGVATSTVKITYESKQAASATRAIKATFVSVATKLAWVTTPSFIRINECTPITVQRQDDAGNAVTTGAATAVTSLIFNNGVTGTYYSDSGCTASITSTSIAGGTNSKTIYFKNTTSGQSGILVATAAGLTSADQNVTITANATKLFLNPAPTIKTNTCTAFTIYSVDVNNYATNVTATITVNLTTTGANTYYSDSGCATPITATAIALGTSQIVIYTSNATIEAATLTGTDPSATLSPSSKAVNFNTSTTWWDASWSKRIRIDINNADQAAAFTNQPVLVKLTPSVVDYTKILANGADIRFVASDDTTALDYEFDNWSVNSTSEIWVKIPSIAASSSSEYFYMYFDNISAADAQNPNSVWTNYWSVWHLGEDPTATAPQYYDSKGSGRDGTANNSPGRVVGAIGNAANLNGATDAVDINSDLSAALGGSSTLSFWMRSTQVGNNTMWQAPGITGIEAAGNGNDIFFGWIDATGRIGVTAGNGANAKSNFVVNNNAWRHVTISRNSSAPGTVVFYINGVANGSANSETGNKTTYFDLLGEIGDTGGSPTNYNGYLDEVRIYSSVKNADQIKADYKFMVNTHLLYNSTESGP